MPNSLGGKAAAHIDFILDKVDKRIAQKETRPDIMSGILQNNHQAELALEELSSPPPPSVYRQTPEPPMRVPLLARKKSKKSKKSQGVMGSRVGHKLLDLKISREREREREREKEKERRFKLFCRPYPYPPYPIAPPNPKNLGG